MTDNGLVHECLLALLTVVRIISFDTFHPVDILKCYLKQWVVNFPGKRRYSGLSFNVISVTRGGWVTVGVQFPEKSVT